MDSHSLDGDDYMDVVVGATIQFRHYVMIEMEYI